MHRTTAQRSNDSEIIDEFTSALQGAQIVVNCPLQLDGHLHRLPVQGDRKGATSGTYKLHLDTMPVGYIKNWKTGYESRWTPQCVTPLSAADRLQAVREIRERAIRDAKARDDRQHQAAIEARALIANARPALSHPYLTSKSVSSHGLLLFGNNDLLLPLQTIDGAIWNCQRISFDASNNQNDKMYMKGARAKGTFHPIGSLDADYPLVIVEGYSTGASVHEATKLPVLVACHSGNLVPVAQALREKYPARIILLAGDNDHHLPRKDVPLPNVGIVKAEEAATAINALTIFPDFHPSSHGSDWNDYCQIHGRKKLQQLFQRKLSN